MHLGASFGDDLNRPHSPLFGGAQRVDQQLQILVADEYMRPDRRQALGFQLVTHYRQHRRRLRGVAQRRDFKPRAGEKSRFVSSSDARKL